MVNMMPRRLYSMLTYMYSQMLASILFIACAVWARNAWIVDQQQYLMVTGAFHIVT